MAEMLFEFSERLRDSGYGERFQVEVIRSILEVWREDGGQAELEGINWPRKWNLGEREESKWRKKTSW